MLSIKNIADIVKSIGSKNEWQGNGFTVALKSQWLVEYREANDHRVAELGSEPLIDSDGAMHRGIYLKTLKWRLGSEPIHATEEEKKLITERVKEALLHLEPSAELILD